MAKKKSLNNTKKHEPIDRRIDNRFDLYIENVIISSLFYKDNKHKLFESVDNTNIKVGTEIVIINLKENIINTTQQLCVYLFNDLILNVKINITFVCGKLIEWMETENTGSLKMKLILKEVLAGLSFSTLRGMLFGELLSQCPTMQNFVLPIIEPSEMMNELF